MTLAAIEEFRIFLSTLPPERAQRRLALAVIVISVAVFLLAAPFAKVPLTPVAAFLPIYQSALILNDLITSVLLLPLGGSMSRMTCGSRDGPRTEMVTPGNTGVVKLSGSPLRGRKRK